MIKENLENILKTIENGNNLGEKITLVGATKFVPVDCINEAISLGLTNIGENKAQEFKDKFPLVLPCSYHFIGYLQTNKVKYLIGKASLIESVDRYELIDEIDKQSQNKNVITNILLEINVGQEENKHGFTLSEVDDAVKYTLQKSNICLKGFMSMLPDFENKQDVGPLCDKLREKYDEISKTYPLEILSCGISGDYIETIKHGSNMVRIGTAIFGKRY